MRDKILFNSLLTFCLLCVLSVKSRAQDATVEFGDIGVSIAFKARKVSADSNRKYRIDDNFYSQMYVEKNKNKTLHRVVSDRESGLYFGYDLKIGFDVGTGKASFSVLPLSIKPIMEKPLRDLTASSLPEYPEMMIVEDGDLITLDILENPQTKVKIVDTIKVKIAGIGKAATSAVYGGKNSSAVPTPPVRDLKLENFQTMKLTNVKIFVNGVQAADPGGMTGPIMYFYIPEKGRFIFSLSPHEGYDFQKIGTLAGNEISFTANGDSYKLVSSSPILAAGGSWNLWVLYDPKFRPDAGFSSFSPYWMGVADRVEAFFKENK